MKSRLPVGIAGYGAYVPRYRVLTESINSTWKPLGAAAPSVREKSVPSADEDVVTMSIEAARTALDRSGLHPSRIGAVWVGSESKPYAVKPSATIVAEAVGVTPSALAADLEFACKAGSEAMQAAVGLVGSGMAEGALAIGMDVSQSKPGDPLEYTAGAGGAAFVLASADESIAVVERSVSYVTDTPDFFRREGAAYPEHGGRFTGEPSYFEHTTAASKRLLTELDAEPGDFAHAVFHQPVPKFVRRVARQLGFTAEQIETGLVAPQMGNAYSGSSLLGLAAILDVARPGDRIFFCSYGSGAGSDAFAFTVTDTISEHRAGATVADYLSRRREIGDYGHYLRLQRKIRRS